MVGRPILHMDACCHYLGISVTILKIASLEVGFVQQYRWFGWRVVSWCIYYIRTYITLRFHLSLLFVTIVNLISIFLCKYFRRHQRGFLWREQLEITDNITYLRCWGNNAEALSYLLVLLDIWRVNCSPPPLATTYSIFKLRGRRFLWRTRDEAWQLRNFRSLIIVLWSVHLFVLQLLLFGLRTDQFFHRLLLLIAVPFLLLIHLLYWLDEVCEVWSFYYLALLWLVKWLFFLWIIMFLFLVGNINGLFLRCWRRCLIRVNLKWVRQLLLNLP